ncbi:pyruvate kinase [Candidatus Parcubacteria bacterium]|nr:pyruvate kinase [Candidatus Parcubacteria bacterium]
MNSIQKEILKKKSLGNTKVVATIGPETKDKESIEAIVKEGVSIFRINFSHGTHESNGEIIKNIREIEKIVGIPLTVFADLQGPKIRLGKIKDGKDKLKLGQEFILTTQEILGDNKMASITDIDIKDIEAGKDIYINDGLVKLQITKIVGDKIYTQVVDDGDISDGRGVNFPGTTLSLPAITPKDKEDLAFALKAGVDCVALSFVRDQQEIQELRNLMGDNQVPIIAKIEKWEAVENIESIIQAADVIMVARGDLGVELPIEKIPLIQKRIISLAHTWKKPVITATQMLISMVENPTPTRPEITDIANAIFDGTDAVMLSNETATGRFPLRSVQTMQRIIQTTEKSDLFEYFVSMKGERVEKNYSAAIGASAVEIAGTIGACAIFCATELGRTARLISSRRPLVPIFALTAKDQTMKDLNFFWGIIPIVLDKVKDAEAIFQTSEKIAKELELGGDGDSIVVTSGSKPGITGGTNLVKIQNL